MQSGLLEQQDTTVAVDLFGQAMFLQQTALMVLAAIRAVVHFQAAWTQTFKLVVVVPVQVETAPMQFHPTVVLEV
jgi:hypothetical protein